MTLKDLTSGASEAMAPVAGLGPSASIFWIWA